MNVSPIVVIEPQMDGVGHAGFNAALLHTVGLAYPQAAISFRALPQHEQAVREVLSQHAPELIERIAWQSLPAVTGSSLLARWRHSDRLLREVLSTQQRLLFCSISRRQLFQLKRQMRNRRTGEVRVVHHGDLDLLEEQRSRLADVSPLSFSRILLNPNPERLGHVVLGHAIYNNIPPRYKAAMTKIGVIDHPYHFAGVVLSAAGEPVFGIFGNAGDGRMLAQIAGTVRAAEPAARFRLVGFVADRAAVQRLAELVDGAGTQPITRKEFLARAVGVTHALWLARAGSYRLRASGTFFDALAFLKPLLYTANSYVDQYYDADPAIGWRCDSVAALTETILDVIRDRSGARYAAAQAAMLRMRERFAPQSLAKRLPGALAWDGTECVEERCE